MKEQKIEYDIIGMHCAACSARIENRLSKEEGIIDVAVNLALETGSVLYDSEKISPDKIADIVDKKDCFCLPLFCHFRCFGQW